ncbi:MAG: TonB-dependent receptor [Flavobacteriales bacterium]|nr:TonB-dependent receptor [Flavobacteriales bacterium]
MLRTIFRKLILFCALALPVSMFSQTGTVKGFVYEQENGEPSSYTPVNLVGTTMGASTDDNGYFSISRIPPGIYTIRIIYLGFDTLTKQVEVKANQIVTEKLYVKKTATQLGSVEVTAEKRQAEGQVRIGITTLTPKQIERLPAIGGQADLAQYMQVVPGVIFTGDQGGQLYIRGGSPIMNKVLLDGMVLYNPFHSIGLFSVFDNDIIRNADIMTGGFNAEHGGRVSSVMDITTRDGNKQHFSGKVAASTFAAKAMFEGPLKKAKNPGDGGSSFLLNFKHSYLATSSKTLYTFVDSAGLPFTFTDLYGKVSLNAANGSKVNLFGFSFSDGVKYRGVSDLGWTNSGGGTSFVLAPSGSAVLIDGVFALSNYKIKLTERDLPERNSSINSFNAGLNFKYFVGDNEAKYGVDIVGVKTDFNYFNSTGLSLSQQKISTEIAGYLNYKIKVGKLVLDPGVRAHYYATPAIMSIEPRFGFKFNLSDPNETAKWPKVRVKGAVGQYSQNLIAAQSDRDVVNLFYGFLTAPEDIPSTFTEENGTKREVTDPIQRANHFIFGFEVDINKNLKGNLEGYLKDFRQVTNLNRDKQFDDSPEFASQPEEKKKDFVLESGKAYGADVLLQYEKNHTYIWVVYSLNFVNRWDGVREYNPIWDRRHNANLVISQAFGKFNSWKASARWNYGSGFPFTPTQGFYEELPFNNGIGQDIPTANGNLGVLYGDLNGKRLPDYHRLDLGVTKTWKFSDRSVLQVDLSVTNTYDRRNIFYFDRVTAQRKDQLPLLPSVGMSFTF